MHLLFFSTRQVARLFWLLVFLMLVLLAPVTLLAVILLYLLGKMSSRIKSFNRWLGSVIEQKIAEDLFAISFSLAPGNDSSRIMFRAFFQLFKLPILPSIPLMVCLGVATLIIVGSVMNGFQREMKLRLRGTMTDITVRFRGNPKAGDSIKSLNLGSDKRVNGVSPRLKGLVYIGTGRYGKPGAILGIDPVEEARVSNLEQYLKKGMVYHAMTDIYPVNYREMVRDANLVKSLGDLLRMLLDGWNTREGNQDPSLISIFLQKLDFIYNIYDDLQMTLPGNSEKVRNIYTAAIRYLEKLDIREDLSSLGSSAGLKEIAAFADDHKNYIKMQFQRRIEYLKNITISSLDEKYCEDPQKPVFNGLPEKRNSKFLSSEEKQLSLLISDYKNKIKNLTLPSDRLEYLYKIQKRLSGSKKSSLLDSLKKIIVENIKRTESALKESPKLTLNDLLKTEGSLKRDNSLARYLKKDLWQLGTYQRNPNWKVIVGQEFLDVMNLRIGDWITVATGYENEDSQVIQRLGVFKIMGVFRSGLYTFDSNVLVINRKVAESFLDKAPDSFSEISVSVYREEDIEKVAEDIEKANNKLGVSTWQRKRADLLKAVQLENYFVKILMIVVVLIAGFIMLALFHFNVRAKRRDLSVLRAIGASSRSIVGIVVAQGIILGLAGGLSGWVLGWLMARNINGIERFMVNYTGISPFPKDVYYMDQIPIDPHWDELLTTVSLTVGCAIIIGSILPAIYAAMQDPMKGIRYE